MKELARQILIPVAIFALFVSFGARDSILAQVGNSNGNGNPNASPSGTPNASPSASPSPSGQGNGNPNRGAIWTTDLNCQQVNQNIYENLQDVYLNGGPNDHGRGGEGLPPGLYYTRVTVPGGGQAPVMLGHVGGPITVGESGVFGQCLNLYSLTEFTQTTNSGGEYMVWLSQNQSFPDPESKTDNFKVESVQNQASPSPSPSPTASPVSSPSASPSVTPSSTPDPGNTGDNGGSGGGSDGGSNTGGVVLGASTSNTSGNSARVLGARTMASAGSSENILLLAFIIGSTLSGFGIKMYATSESQRS